MKEIFTVQAREGGLALDIPSQMVFALNPPNAQGRWQFALTDQIAVSFRRNDGGEVVAINVHQQGMTFEAMREGVVEERRDRSRAARHVPRHLPV